MYRLYIWWRMCVCTCMCVVGEGSSMVMSCECGSVRVGGIGVRGMS